ncbi:hypothetical protein MT418_003157 [Batrachochytrium dendrobatidis]
MAFWTPQTLDISLNAFFHYLLLNAWVAPLFWLSIPFFMHGFFPLLGSIILWMTCFALASISIVRLMLQKPATRITSWSTEIIIITGGSHGIGAVLTDILANTKKVKKVVVLDKIPPTIQAENVCYFECDVSDSKAVEQVGSKIVNQVGNPTALINSAGIVSGKTMMDLTVSEIKQTIGVNLLGPFYTIKAFLPGFMDRNKGHIINIASVLGLSGTAQVSDYCASKFGVVGMTESLRQEIAHSNVYVTCVYPGLTTTGMFEGLSHKFPWLTPFMEPKRVAHAIVDALESGQSHDIKFPLYAHALPLLHILPIEISDLVKCVSFSNWFMSCIYFLGFGD